MDIKRISNVIIIQEGIKVDGNMFLIAIECENRGKDSSPYTVSYYVLGYGGGLANVTEQVNNLNIKAINKLTETMLYKLGTMLEGNIHESEYC